MSLIELRISELKRVYVRHELISLPLTAVFSIAAKEMVINDNHLEDFMKMKFILG